ncbi:hypothetical protein OG478_03805 [Streptomyces phaeochromogenes]|nr:hypothetical protein OG478_03805 [Streptomyces phaeochromogenes]
MARRGALEAALSAETGVQPELFRVVTVDEFGQLITGAQPDAPTDATGPP